MLKRMWPYMSRYKKYLAISCFCVVAETVFELIIPIIMADIIDIGVANADKDYILIKGAQTVSYTHLDVYKRQDTVFECKLISKGAGTYFIPISKAVVQQLNSDGEIPVSFEIIRELTRINKNSPYTTDHPVRKIDHIQEVVYPKPGYCGQICIAMLSGLPIEDVIDFMQTKPWQCSLSRVMEALHYFCLLYTSRCV